MSAFPYLALLFCLVGYGVHVTPQYIPSPTSNPECPGMHRVAQSLEKGIKTYTREATICKVNGHCTGLMCNGTHQQNDFYMKMELKHCKTPPEIHLDLVYQPYNIKVHQELKDGQIKISSKKTPLGTVPIELKLTLKKDKNRITTGLEVEVCQLGCRRLATLLPLSTFCLNMKTCPGYNSTGDIPCHITPTATTAGASSGILSTSTNPTSKPRIHLPTHHSVSHTTLPTPVFPTEHSSSTLRFSTNNPTQHSGATPQPGDTHALKRKSGLHHITTGAAVGIAFACVTGILIIVGALVYWKKFYRRSRLRAAYYNDISINDPLYEDFGPEEA